MKCQKCNEKNANVRYTQMINGIKKQIYLCDKCAKELGIDDLNLDMDLEFRSLFEDLDDVFNIYEKSVPRLRRNNLAFNNCNMLFDDFFDTVTFLFDNNYSLFESNVDQLIKHKNTQNKSSRLIEKLLNS